MKRVTFLGAGLRMQSTHAVDTDVEAIQEAFHGSEAAHGWWTVTKQAA